MQTSKKVGNNHKKMIAELNGIIEQTFYLEQKIYEFSRTVQRNKANISKSMGTKNRLSVAVDKHLSFNVVKSTEPVITFFPKQLSKNLDKKKYNQVVDKTIEIDDTADFIRLLKRHDVPPADFKKFIKVTETVNTENLDRLMNIGDIDIKDLQGCYTATFDEEIRIRKDK